MYYEKIFAVAFLYTQIPPSFPLETENKRYAELGPGDPFQVPNSEPISPPHQLDADRIWQLVLKGVKWMSKVGHATTRRRVCVPLLVTRL